MKTAASTERALALAAGFQLYFCKPVDMERLVEAVSVLHRDHASPLQGLVSGASGKVAT